MNLLHLIYGYPTTGKSYVIRELRDQYDLVILDTDDYVRSFLNILGFRSIKHFNSVCSVEQFNRAQEAFTNLISIVLDSITTKTLVFTNMNNLLHTYHPDLVFVRNKPALLHELRLRDGEGYPIWVDMLPSMDKFNPIWLEKGQYISDYLPLIEHIAGLV